MSLLTTPVRQLATCPHCASHRLIRIAMTLTDGSAVDFASCLRCERKTWTQGGSDLSVTEVLKKATKPGAQTSPMAVGAKAGASAK